MEKSSFWKRIIFTLLILAVYKVGTRIPVPWINQQVLGSALDFGKAAGLFEGSQGVAEQFQFPRLSILGLGIMAYVEAAIIIELLIFAFPASFLSRMSGGIEGRRQVFRITCYLTLIIAIIHSYGLVSSLGEMRAPGGLNVMPTIDWEKKLIISLSLLSGMFFLIWLAEQITRKGIGNGISLIILISSIPITPSNIAWLQRGYKLGEINFSPPFLALLYIGPIVLIFLMERAYLRIPVHYQHNNHHNKKEFYLPYKITPAGVVPLSWAVSFVMFPCTIFRFIDHPIARYVSDLLSPGSILHHILLFAILLIFYYLFAAIFYNTHRIKRYLKKVGACFGKTSSDPISEENITKTLYKIAFVGCLYLFLFNVLPTLLIALFNLPFFYGGVELIVFTAIIMDLIMEVRGYINPEQGNLIKIAKLHDVPQAGLIKNVLEQHDIFCHVQGYYHRSLLYLFGPFIEMGIMVPQLKAAQAKALIEEYIDREGNILTE